MTEETIVEETVGKDGKPHIKKVTKTTVEEEGEEDDEEKGDSLQDLNEEDKDQLIE